MAESTSLLSSSESSAIWSFLSQADKADVLAPEWSIFAGKPPELTSGVRTFEGKEDLTRATRSLTSLEDAPLPPENPPAYSSHRQHRGRHNPLEQQHQQQAYTKSHYPPPLSIPPPISIHANVSASSSTPVTAADPMSYYASFTRYDPSTHSSSSPSVPTASPGVSYPQPKQPAIQLQSESQPQPQASGSTSSSTNKKLKRLSQDHAHPNPNSTKRARRSSPGPGILPSPLNSGFNNAFPSPYSTTNSAASSSGTNASSSANAVPPSNIGPSPTSRPMNQSRSLSTISIPPEDDKTTLSFHHLGSSSTTSVQTIHTPVSSSSRTTSPIQIPIPAAPTTASPSTSTASASIPRPRPTPHQAPSSLAPTSISAHQAHSTSKSHPHPLLSTSQKKANHIQSEQKRRANIRRGYEALCEVVPALREAIRAEEEIARLGLDDLSASITITTVPLGASTSSGGADEGSGGDGVVSARGGSGDPNGEKPDEGGKGTGGGGGGGNPSAAVQAARKKARGRAVAAAFGVEDGEKVDGRAGPRSEAVVLQKTLDYLTGLTQSRSSLLQRLHSLRAMLPSSHPALIPSPIPIERVAQRRGAFLPPIEGTLKPPGIFDSIPLPTSKGMGEQDSGATNVKQEPEQEGSSVDFQEVWTKEDIEAWWANEGSCAPEFDESVYEVLPRSSSSSGPSVEGAVPAIPIWNRAWDGGTGLPMRGMGLMKPGMRGFGPGGGGAMEGPGGKKRRRKRGEDYEYEEGDDGEVGEDGEEGEGSDDEM